MGMLKSILFLYTIVSKCNVVRLDLPIHAVMSDVLGTWKFTLSATTSTTPMGCGGGIPNMNVENLEPALDNFYSWLGKDTGVGISTRFVLTKNTASRVDGPGRKEWRYLLVMLPGSMNGVGTWTMVYDEGFELRVGSTRFFAILKYNKEEGRSCTGSFNGDAENTFGRTKCYSTDPSRVQMGWTYRERRGETNGEHQWGCFYAEKEHQPDAGALVISGHNYRSPKLPPLSDFLNSDRETSWKASNTQFRDVPHEHLASYKGHLGYEKIHKQVEFTLPMFRQSLSTETIFPCPILSVPRQANTASTGSIPSTWTWGDPFLTDGYDPTSDFVLNQRNCGSCYAVSASFVLQRRFEILFKRLFPESQLKVFDLPLSPQTLLSCSVGHMMLDHRNAEKRRSSMHGQIAANLQPFNQGCDGGYPFLIGKHAREIGIGTENCQLYHATDSPEAAPCLMNIGNFRRSPKETASGCGPDERWYARDYNYVGGFYEGCNERRIMEEIYHNGPVVAAIDAPDALFLYEDGFFDSMPEEHGRLCEFPRQDFTGWEYTNHAVAIVGWGEDPPTMPGMPRRKFWVVRNTWGNEWGRNGYIKMKRGENLAAIESQAVAIDPDITRGKAAHVLKLFQKYTRPTKKLA